MRGPETIGDLFVQTADRIPGSPALAIAPEPGPHDEPTWLTFEEVAQAAAGFAAILTERGVRFGDRIVIALDTTVQGRIVDQALLTWGLVRVSVSSRLTAFELVAIASDSQASIICVEPSALEAVAAVLAQSELDCAVTAVGEAEDGLVPGSYSQGVVTTRQMMARSEHQITPRIRPRQSADDVAMLLYSSGTTGRPKAAVVTHQAWLARAKAARLVLPPVGDNDTLLLAAPMSQFSGSCALDAALDGARTLVQRRFEAASVTQAVVSLGVTLLPLAPVMLDRLARHLESTGERLSSLRSVPYGGSPIAAPAVARAARVLPGVLTQCYGLSEVLAPIAALGPMDHDRAARLLDASREGVKSTILESTADVQVATIDIRRSKAIEILTSAGHIVPPNKIRFRDGEILVHGPTTASMFWRRPSMTSSRMVGGWMSTGDRGYIDSDGRLHVLGRADDVIITGGFNVEPSEVEAVIAEVPGVVDVAVFGLPDYEWGEGITAAMVILSEFSESQIRTAVFEVCRSRLAGYKKPLAIHILDHMPRTAVDKVDRAELRRSIPPRPSR